jgi:glycosyltransferase involved in cell wall biosynthesis
VIRLLHVWSSDMGLSLSLPYVRPLIARGWEVYGMCPPGPRLGPVEAAGVRWLPHPIERRLGARGDAEGALLLLRTFRRLAVDIVHTHNIKVGLIARVVAAAARVPIVVHTHHGLAFSTETPLVARTAHAAMERAANLGVARLFVQSEEDRRTLLATGAARAEQIELTGNGVDLARFAFDPARRAAARARLGLRDDEVLFFSAGRIVREKGFVELFEAAGRARARDPRVRLAVAGPVDVEKADAVDAVTLERARRDGVLVLGERDSTDMPDLYSASDVVALVSWREGLPRVLMEGAAAGRALLASDARGCREVVSPDMGVLVPVRDPGALSEAMLSLAADPARRAALGARAHEEAAARFDIAKVVARVIAVYDELLALR